MKGRLQHRGAGAGQPPFRKLRETREATAMTDRQLDRPVHGTSPFRARDLFMREWPYLVMLALAIFGVAYTSFAQRPLTVYWMTLVPFIGTICVLARWRDVESKNEHLRLIWTQALHWGAVLLAMN